MFNQAQMVSFSLFPICVCNSSPDMVLCCPHWFIETQARPLSNVAHVVTCSLSCSPRTLLQQLHWLPIKQRIDFKIANIIFGTLHFSQPAYLRSSLHACHSTRSLRLSNTNLLSAPFVRISFGSRRFSVVTPKIWISPPLYLRTCTSPDTFRRHLKTHYCQQAFQAT